MATAYPHDTDSNEHTPSGVVPIRERDSAQSRLSPIPCCVSSLRNPLIGRLMLRLITFRTAWMCRSLNAGGVFVEPIQDYTAIVRPQTS